MKIWVDADACPSEIKDLLFRAADRVPIQVTLVANQKMRIARSDFVDLILVTTGPDIADDYIADHVQPEDLVVTADIPLAARVVENGGTPIDPRGNVFTVQNIGERLATRDFMDQLRNSGVETGGPAAFDNKDKQAFANQLDRLLTKWKRSQQNPAQG
jgi:uncharacterized protein